MRRGESSIAAAVTEATRTIIRCTTAVDGRAHQAGVGVSLKVAVGLASTHAAVMIPPSSQNTSFGKQHHVGRAECTWLFQPLIG